MSRSTEIRELIERLCDYDIPNVFNPWRDSDPLDRGDGPRGRRNRLAAHLDRDAKLLLVGEAPGYQGCHFSGIPFTSERLLCEGWVPGLKEVDRFTKRERPWSEPSATIVWTTLYELELHETTVMWNAFPFHPHEPNDPYTNRAPTPRELQLGYAMTHAITHLWPGVRVVPVGRIAEELLRNMCIPCEAYVRHPANGGALLFRAGLAGIAAYAREPTKI